MYNQLLKFCAIYSVCPSSVEFNPHCCLLFTALRVMGDLYNKWGQYEKAEECLREALDIIESAYLTGHVEAAQGELTMICNDCLSTLFSALTLTLFSHSHVTNGWMLQKPRQVH